MSNKPFDFYAFLKKEVASYKGPLDGYIYFLPDIFQLLSDILANDELKQKDRELILASLGYFVLPDDVIPESIYGPFGFLDDMFLSCYTLELIKVKYGEAILRDLWSKDEDVCDVIDYCIETCREELGPLVQEILSFVGLDEY